MFPSALSDLASVVGGTIEGNPVISGLAIDSRKVTHGDLFVALVAERDGHDFIDNAAESGASAALVKANNNIAINFRSRHRVRDGNIACAIRDSFVGEVFALTGSQGKPVRAGFGIILTKMVRASSSELVLMTQGI